MRNSCGTRGRNVFARVAVLGLVSGALAGCSSDVGRFSGQPAAPDVTGSLGSMAGRAPAPVGAGQGYGMQPYANQAYGAAANQAYGAAQPYAGQAASYAASGEQLYGTAQQTYNSGVQTASRMGNHVVEGGETLNSVAQRYNVQPAALAAANGIAPGNTVRTGQSLIIPQASAVAQGVATASLPSGQASTPQNAALQPTTLQAQAAAVPAPAARPVVAAALPPANPAPVAPASVAASVPPAASTTPAAAKAAAPASVAEAVDKVDDEPRKAGSGPQFRAPVRGRVIAGFGPKPGGTRNEGVNFAVPAGTAVRAAEDGVVAYSGNELKGYGNLVLVKHADGYVTAYAHNSELTVKRGETVRRGQIIAKAGQTGNVQSPQLHFEIRKGSTPVDPSSYVAGL